MPRTRIGVLLAPTLVVCLALVGCGADDADGTAGSGGSGETSGEQVDVGGAAALIWGDGDYGVVLAHGAAFDAASWEAQAVAIAEQGARVVAVEEVTPEAIAAAVTALQDDGVSDVALVGASAGADAILDLASDQPDLPDQLVLISPNTTVEGLGDEPKLFVASEDEAVADVSTELAETAPGDDNEAVLLPGSAHAQNIFDTDQADRALQAVLERLAR